MVGFVFCFVSGMSMVLVKLERVDAVIGFVFLDGVFV